MSPLTAKGEEIKAALSKEYGAEKGERVLYAGQNKGTFSGIDEIARMTQVSEGPGLDAVLNWGGSVNGQTVLPGGKADTPNMPRSASVATGVGTTSSGDASLVANMKSAASAGAEVGRKIASGEVVSS